MDNKALLLPDCGDASLPWLCAVYGVLCALCCVLWS